MKIIYFSQHPNLNLLSASGPGTHMREMINAFRKLGHEVFPVILGGAEVKENSDAKKNRVKKIIKIIIPSFFWETIKDLKTLLSNYSAQRMLEKKIIEFPPDIIYERAGFMQIAGARAAKQFGIKHFIEFNSLITEEKIMFKGKSFFISKSKKLEQELLNSADKILFVSSRLREYFQEKFELDYKKTLITPNAINPENIKPDYSEISRIKLKYQLENKMVIGFVGSVFPYHGVDILIEAFAKVFLKYSNTRLMIVGDGEVLGDLKNLTRKQQVFNEVIFTGNIPPKDVFNYIQVFDIAVLPKTKDYMSPIKIFEYGALGKPVIAPDVSSVRDVMTDKINGLLTEPNAEKLASLIITLIEDVETRKKLGENFRKKVMDEYTWEKTAKKILSSQQ